MQHFKHTNEPIRVHVPRLVPLAQNMSVVVQLLMVKMATTMKCTAKTQWPPNLCLLIISRCLWLV